MTLLKEIRERAGKRQEDVCVDLQISFSTINRHERGKIKKLSTGHRAMYANYFGVPAESIEVPPYTPRSKARPKRRSAASKPKTPKRRAA